MSLLTFFLRYRNYHLINMFLIPLQLFFFLKRQGVNLLVSWLIQVIQGGIINRRLLVAGPLPPPLGGFEGQDEINPPCDIPSDGVNGGLDVGWPSVTMEITCRQVIAQSSARDSKILRFLRISARAGNGFQYEKSAKKQQCGPDPKRPKEAE
jgi:hypothetical protein